VASAAGCSDAAAIGEAMQADPMKPVLKAPGTIDLKPFHNKLLSNVAFKFNMRRYTLPPCKPRLLPYASPLRASPCKSRLTGRPAGAYNRPLFRST